MWRVEEAGGGLTDLTGHLDRSVDPFQVSPSPSGPQWVEGGFTTLIEERGGVRVIRVGDDGSIDEAVGGDRVVTGASPSSDGSIIAFVATEPTDPGDVWLIVDGEERRITELNDAFRDEVDLVTPQHFEVSTGDTVLDVWTYLPPGDDPVPLLLNIHGGPASAYGWTFFDEFQVGAGRRVRRGRHESRGARAARERITSRRWSARVGEPSIWPTSMPRSKPPSRRSPGWTGKGWV